eukprot:jgi/Botrbrau1/8891/Bobra.0148s0011.1
MTKEALELFRELYRQTRSLPRSSWSYYRRYIRENFEAFSDETDPQRLRQLIQQARKDAGWVVAKYGKTGQGGSPPG